MALFGPPSQGYADCPFAEKSLKTGVGEALGRELKRVFFRDILKAVTPPRC